MLKKFFESLLAADSEEAVSDLLSNTSGFFEWRPLGGNENNFGVIENQQASPVAALIEKVTNRIDAILLRRCLEEEIDPKSPTAPRSMAEAVERFFTATHKSWHLCTIGWHLEGCIRFIACGYQEDP